MFSDRSSVARDTNALSRALAERRARSLPILDLTVSNPTSAGIAYDDASIRAALSEASIVRYEPHAFGMLEARRTIQAELAQDGIELDPARIVLTASTSEAYAFAFTLLCDPGDEVLVPQPSYPLLAHLAGYAGVTLSPYSLRYDGRWHPDATELWESIGDRTRAIVVVSPNNPTGSYLVREEAEALASLGLPLIVDEVFARYPLEAPDDRVRAATLSETLVLALDGLSKRAALPHMKLAWTTVTGPDHAVEEALSRLELIADSYLSVATPVQLALPDLLKSADVAREAILARARTNLAVLRELARETAMTVPRVEGGWYAPVRMPATRTDEAWALELLQRGVHVHPGYFYDFEGDEAWLVLSLLTPENDFRRGVELLRDSI